MLARLCCGQAGRLGRRRTPALARAPHPGAGPRRRARRGQQHDGELDPAVRGDRLRPAQGEPEVLAVPGLRAGGVTLYRGTEYLLVCERRSAMTGASAAFMLSANFVFETKKAAAKPLWVPCGALPTSSEARPARGRASWGTTTATWSRPSSPPGCAPRTRRPRARGWRRCGRAGCSHASAASRALRRAAIALEADQTYISDRFARTSYVSRQQSAAAND